MSAESLRVESIRAEARQRKRALRAALRAGTLFDVEASALDERKEPFEKFLAGHTTTLLMDTALRAACEERER